MVQVHPSLGLTVVVGGGPVGTRKVRTLLDAGFCVRWVQGASVPDEAASTLYENSGLEVLARPVAPEDLNGARWLILATNDPVLHERYTALGRQKHLWVTDAAGGRSDVTFAAFRAYEDLLIGVATLPIDHRHKPGWARAVLQVLFQRTAWADVLTEARRLVQGGTNA